MLGRLRVLRNGALIGVAVFVVLGVSLMNAVGPWGALAIVVALVFAGFAAVDEWVARRSGMSQARASSDDPLTDEARTLWQEMRAFYIEQQEGLPPLDLVIVGRSPPGALEAWKEARDRDTLAEFNRVFGTRLARVYEGLRDRRGYGHPLMEGRYNDLRAPGEIFTVSRALAQMIGMPFLPIPGPANDYNPRLAGEASPPLRADILASVIPERELRNGVPGLPRLKIENKGTATAEQITFRLEGSMEDQQLPEVLGADRPVAVLRPGADIQYPLAVAYGMDPQFEIVLEWQEGGELRTQTQTLRT
jgi:hypothetical protein